MRIYTKEGDAGMSSVIGSKKRIQKSDQIFELLGLADEVSATLGCAIAQLKRSRERLLLEQIQGDLFHIGSYIAGLKFSPAGRVLWTERVSEVEKNMDGYAKKLPEIRAFVLPGGSVSSSQLHMARARVRTLERVFISYINKSKRTELKFFLPYINRLSDFLFVLARYVNVTSGKKERLWKLKE